jgi:hypothetical protein
MLRFIAIVLFSISCTSQTQDAKIFFADGDTLDGLGMIFRPAMAMPGSETKIKFRLSLDAEPDIWTYREITRIEFYEFNQKRVFEYLLFPPYKTPELLEVVTEGEVKLYATFEATNNINPIAGNGATVSAGGQTMGIPGLGFAIDLAKASYYVKRKTDAKPFAIGGGLRNWAKNAQAYFKDCPLLVRKIKQHEFLKSEIKEVVDFYNDICSGE